MKNGKIFFVGVFCVVAAALGNSRLAAQPSAVKNVGKSVFTLTTFRADGSLLGSSHGVFVSETGEAVSDLKPFIGAARAVVIDQKGKQMDVVRMLGVNELYDVARFRVDGKTVAAPVAASPVEKGGQAWLVGYHPKSPELTAVTVKDVEPFMEQYAYYIFEVNAPDNAIACPFANEQGEVIGLMKVSTTTFNTHATDVRFVRSLTVNGLSFTDANLRKIGIPVALPADETQAQLALIMAGQSGDSLKYDAAITDFMEQFPQRVDGYEARARWLMMQGKLSESSNVMSQALSVVTNKDDVHYQYGKIIYDALTEIGLTGDEWTLDKAQEEIMSAIQIQDLPAYHQLLGQILFAKGEYQTACDLFLKLHDDAAPNGELLYQAARCQQMLGAQPMAVVDMLKRAIDETDTLRLVETAPYFLLRAEMYEQADSFRQAVFDYTRYEILMQGKLGASFYYIREQAEVRGKLYQQALTDIMRAALMEPDEPAYFAEMASLQLRVNMPEQAVKAAERCIELSPDDSDGYLLLGVAQARTGQKAEGLANLQKAKELGNEQADGLIEKYSK
jgi:tetratricopeptide (TPR) repeat protein